MVLYPELVQRLDNLHAAIEELHKLVNAAILYRSDGTTEIRLAKIEYQIDYLSNEERIINIWFADQKLFFRDILMKLEIVSNQLKNRESCIEDDILKIHKRIIELENKMIRMKNYLYAKDN